MVALRFELDDMVDMGLSGTSPLGTAVISIEHSSIMITVFTYILPNSYLNGAWNNGYQVVGCRRTGPSGYLYAELHDGEKSQGLNALRTRKKRPSHVITLEHEIKYANLTF